MANLVPFLGGIVACTFLVAGLFFLRFWKRTGDSLFRTFAFAFWLLALAQSLLVLLDIPVEERSWIYVLRLLAFALIVSAIIGKNRPTS
ncbi:hypothetical protein ACFB49_27180 [Sphingomonas sp. DBB INV C78]|uniref:DUF5985 family protein n=1 Tax=Sphingomonas sp. DBB INV C78 TaxID=3349434 RepID=UPI0036D2379E